MKPKVDRKYVVEKCEMCEEEFNPEVIGGFGYSKFVTVYCKECAEWFKVLGIPTKTRSIVGD